MGKSFHSSPHVTRPTSTLRFLRLTQSIPHGPACLITISTLSSSHSNLPNAIFQHLQVTLPSSCHYSLKLHHGLGHSRKPTDMPSTLQSFQYSPSHSRSRYRCLLFRSQNSDNRRPATAKFGRAAEELRSLNAAVGWGNIETDQV